MPVVRRIEVQNDAIVSPPPSLPVQQRLPAQQKEEPEPDIQIIPPGGRYPREIIYNDALVPSGFNASDIKEIPKGEERPAPAPTSPAISIYDPTKSHPKEKKVKEKVSFLRLKPWMDHMVFPTSVSIGTGKTDFSDAEWALKALQEQLKKIGGDNQLHIEPPEKGTVALNQWGTVTNDQVKNMPQPKYYDPNSGLALNTWGLFLAGMAQPTNWIAKKMGKKDEELVQVDPTKLDTSGKIAYYTGRATFEAAAGYGTGEALGMAWGNLPKVGRVLSKVRGGKTIVKAATKVDDLFKGVSKTRPWVPKALSGTVKGMIVGTEATRGIMIKERGGSWLDVAGTISSDFLGMYAFEKGITTGFSTARKNVVRKEFADKHSRLFIKQELDIVKDESGNVMMIRGMKGTKEIPEGWPGAISTTPRPRKVMRVFEPAKPDVPLIKPPSKSTPCITLDEEAKFLFGERNLPEALRTQKQLVQRGESVIKSGQQMLKTITGGKATTAAKTITSVSRSATAVQEAARVASMKRAFTSMTKLPNAINDAAAIWGVVNIVTTPIPTQWQSPVTSTGRRVGGGSGQGGGQKGKSNLGTGKGTGQTGRTGQGTTPFESTKSKKFIPNVKGHKLDWVSDTGVFPNISVGLGEDRSTSGTLDTGPDYIKGGSTPFDFGQDEDLNQDENNPFDFGQDEGAGEDEDTFSGPGTTPDVTPSFTPSLGETVVDIGATVGAGVVAGLTKYKPPTRVRRGKVPFVFPTGGSIFGGSGSAWWKKSGRKNKNKIFSFGPINVNILPKSCSKPTKQRKAKNRKKRRR